MKKLEILSLVFFVLGLMDCGKKNDQELIGGVIADIAERAENGDLDGLVKHLENTYSDDEGRDLAQTIDLLSQYFKHYHNIVIHVLGNQFDQLTPTAAEVQTDVGLSAGIFEALRRLIRFSGEYYRFYLTLTKREGRWLVAKAAWEHVTVEELFPESVKTLDKILSDK